MKKILIFASIFALSGCINAGEINFWPARNAIFKDWNTYPIEYFKDQGLKLVKTEKVLEIAPKKGELQRAYTGFSVFYDKKYETYTYQDCFVKANKDGILDAVFAPSEISAKEVKRLLGRINVDGKWYSLFPATHDKYVWLIKEDGGIYNKMGLIRDDRVVLLDTEFTVSPKDLSFEILTETKVEQTSPITGFDVKYGGINYGKVTFMALDYTKYSKDKGDFDVVYFDNKPGQNAVVAGVKIKILSADEKKLDYVILDY